MEWLTVLTVLVCACIWLYLWNYDMGYRSVGFNYDAVVTRGEYWRVMTSSFSHIALLHLGFNMISLYNCRSVETRLGAQGYAQLCLLLILVSEAVVILVSFVRIHRFGHAHVRESYALGYSCVVFGLFTVVYDEAGTKTANLPDSVLMPVAFLVITQVLVPRASFVGHAAGIVAGWLYVFGAFDWFTPYLFWCLVFWVLVAFLGSLKATTDFPLPFIVMEDDWVAALPRARVVNGALVYGSAAGSRANSGMQEADEEEQEEQEEVELAAVQRDDIV